MNSSANSVGFDKLLRSIQDSAQYAVVASSRFVLNSTTSRGQRTQVIAGLLQSESFALCVEGIRCSSSTLVAGLPLDLAPTIGLIGELFDSNEQLEQYCADFFADLNANLATFADHQLQGKFSRAMVRNRRIRVVEFPKFRDLERVFSDLEHDLNCASVSTRMFSILGMSHLLSHALNPKDEYQICEHKIDVFLALAGQDSCRSLRSTADTACYFWDLE